MADEIKIEPVSNRADFLESWQPRDEDGNAIDLTGASIVFEVADPECGAILISATTDNAKIEIDQTIFTVSIARSELTRLDPLAYRVGCTVTQDDFTTQVFVGTFSVYDGVVTV